MEENNQINKGFQKSQGFQQAGRVQGGFSQLQSSNIQFQGFQQSPQIQFQPQSVQNQNANNLFQNNDQPPFMQVTGLNPNLLFEQFNISQNQLMPGQQNFENINPKKLGSQQNLLESLKEKADESTNEGVKTKSNNAKNTYIKKISSITKGQGDYLANLDILESQKNNDKKGVKKNKSQLFQQNSNEEKNDQENQNNNLNNNIDKDQQKLARNRESARNSRKRKKIYLELLENKVISLQQFLQESKNICQNCEMLLNNLQDQIKTKNEVQQKKDILFRNLANALESNQSESNIAGIIDSLKNKFGTVNEDRMNMINYFFKQISDQILPIHMSYIMNAVVEQKDIFTPDQDIQDNKEKNGDMHNILLQLGLSDQQKQSIKKLSKRLVKEKSKMELLVNQLDTCKNEVVFELKSLDETIEQLRKNYQPSQISRFVMQIERNVYKDNMKSAFQHFFSQENLFDTIANLGQSDDEKQNDDKSDIYDFINQDEYNQTLQVDINQAYDIFADSFEFLQKKKKFQKDDK